MGRGGACNKCGRMGHWAATCRVRHVSALEEQSQQNNDELGWQLEDQQEVAAQEEEGWQLGGLLAGRDVEVSVLETKDVVMEETTLLEAPSWARARLRFAGEDVAEALVALREKPGKSVCQGLLESEAGKSVRQGLPEPDPSGVADKTPPLSVTKPLGRAFLANEPGEVPAEILTDKRKVTRSYRGQDHDATWMPDDIEMDANVSEQQCQIADLEMKVVGKRQSVMSPAEQALKMATDTRQRDQMQKVLTSNNCRWLMLDSGSCLHACTPEFAPEVPLQPVLDMEPVCAVNGELIPVYGVKKVHMLLWGHVRAEVLFHVMPVKRTLLSVGLLRKQRLNISLGTQCYPMKENRRLPLVATGAPFFMPVLIEGEKWTREMQGVLKLAHAAVEQKEMMMAALEVPSHLVEWCCEHNGALTEWVTAHGGTATRLGLPDHDMRGEKEVRDVIRDVRRRAISGAEVLIWAAVPCTAWCSWQRVNMQLGQGAAAKIKVSRVESEMLLEKSATFVEQVRGGLENSVAERIHVAFGWPQGAFQNAQSSQALQHIITSLKQAYYFDGCMYGLRNADGDLCRKPWRVQTDWTALRQPLSRRCDGSHHHATTRGTAAHRSERCTPALVSEVGKMLLKAGGAARGGGGDLRLTGTTKNRAAEPRRLPDRGLSHKCHSTADCAASCRIPNGARTHGGGEASAPGNTPSVRSMVRRLHCRAWQGCGTSHARRRARTTRGAA